MISTKLSSGWNIILSAKLTVLNFSKIVKFIVKAYSKHWKLSTTHYFHLSRTRAFYRIYAWLSLIQNCTTLLRRRKFSSWWQVCNEKILLFQTRKRRLDCTRFYYLYLHMTETEILFDGPRPEQIYLFDLKGVSFGHLFKLSLNLIRKGMRFVEDAIPMNIKAIHILNATTHLNFILSNFLFSEINSFIN